MKYTIINHFQIYNVYGILYIYINSIIYNSIAGEVKNEKLVFNASWHTVAHYYCKGAIGKAASVELGAVAVGGHLAASRLVRNNARSAAPQ